MRPSIPVDSPSTSDEVAHECPPSTIRIASRLPASAWLALPVLLAAARAAAAARRLRRRRDRGRRRPPARLARQHQGGRGVLPDQGGAAARRLRRLRARRHHPGRRSTGAPRRASSRSSSTRPRPPTCRPAWCGRTAWTCPTSARPRRRRAAPCSCRSRTTRARCAWSGPDANGSFRAYILDDTAMRFARRHPNVTEVGPDRLPPLPRHRQGVGDRQAVEDGLRPDRSRGAVVGRRADHHRGRLLHVLLQPVELHQRALVQQLLQPHLRRRHALRRPHLRGEALRGQAQHEREGARPERRSRGTSTRTSGPTSSSATSGSSRPPPAPTWSCPSTSTRAARSRSRATTTGGRATRSSTRTATTSTASTSPSSATSPRRSRRSRRASSTPCAIREAEYWYDKLPDSDPLVANGYIGKYTAYNDTARGSWALWINEVAAAARRPRRPRRHQLRHQLGPGDREVLPRRLRRGCGPPTTASASSRTRR